jgi:hypothetical protein
VTLRTRPTKFFCHTRSELRTSHRIRDFSHKAVQNSRLSGLGNAESVQCSDQFHLIGEVTRRDNPAVSARSHVYLERAGLQRSFQRHNRDCVSQSSTTPPGLKERNSKFTSPRLLDAQQVLSPGRESYADAAATPMTDVLLDVFNVVLGSANVAQQADQHFMVRQTKNWAHASIDIPVPALHEPRFLSEMEINKNGGIYLMGIPRSALELLFQICERFDRLPNSKPSHQGR